jgi:hypothetical protein
LTGVVQFLAQVLAANAHDLGGTIEQNSFTAAELATLARRSMSQSLIMINDTEIAITKAHQFEAARMEAKLGAEHPKVVAQVARAEGGVAIARALAQQAGSATIETPEADPRSAAVAVRVVNSKDQGQAGYTVALVRTDGKPLDTIGRTDETGYCAIVFNEAKTASLSKEGRLLLRVLDEAGREVLLTRDPITIEPGANLRLTLTIPVQVVPKSVATDGRVIFTTTAAADRSPATEPSAGSPQAEAPPARTPLIVLDIAAAIRRRLEGAGIQDAEGIVEATMDQVADILGGDRADARNLRALARKILRSTDDQ